MAFIQMEYKSEALLRGTSIKVIFFLQMVCPESGSLHFKQFIFCRDIVQQQWN